jgi:hypothetical protein
LQSFLALGADLKQQDSVVSVVSVVRDCEQLPAKTTEATKNNRVQRRKRPKQPENNRPNGENNRNNSPAVFSRSPRLFLLFYGPRCFRLAPLCCVGVGVGRRCCRFRNSQQLRRPAPPPAPGCSELAVGGFDGVWRRQRRRCGWQLLVDFAVRSAAF